MTHELTHFVTGNPLGPPWPQRMEVTGFAMGCFWGAERLFWRIPGVYETSVGYQGGRRENPSYEQVCSSATGHAEAVRVVFDPSRVSFDELLTAFWENHDPTQGNRQGNDIGSQYRSVIFPETDAQAELARSSMDNVAPLLAKMDLGPVTTQIVRDAKYWLAEEYHQQYLAKNPGGYCGLRGTGIQCVAGGV